MENIFALIYGTPSRTNFPKLRSEVIAKEGKGDTDKERQIDDQNIREQSNTHKINIKSLTESLYLTQLNFFNERRRHYI